jgi:hypothetical protein
MAMEHKAFLFDAELFRVELESIIVEALNSGRTLGLMAFIEANRDKISDPDEGTPIEESIVLEGADIHRIGDFAITKYYEPGKDIGLGNDWTIIQNQLPEPLKGSVLGAPIGSGTRYFDPGRMGSYIQSIEDVTSNLDGVNTWLDGADQPLRMERLVKILSTAKAERLGLYITF